ncbi:MAG: hypothetical protein QOF57_2175, partial [Frankiaceae bacterium]|nr:hypothetical protein [Frankiaceae bacterium]
MPYKARMSTVQTLILGAIAG